MYRKVFYFSLTHIHMHRTGNANTQKTSVDTVKSFNTFSIKFVDFFFLLKK